jgi:homeobox protein YOX1/YHP1
MSADESMLCTTFSLDEGLTDLPSDCFKVLVPSGHRPLAPKRKRANAKQLEVLQQIYEVNKFPNAILREQLAKQLGMTTRGVQIWFQNQRQGAKDRTKSDNIKHSSSSPSPSSSHQYKMVY